MKKKTLQVTVLICVLLAITAGGIWFLTRDPAPEKTDPDTQTVDETLSPSQAHKEETAQTSPSHQEDEPVVYEPFEFQYLTKLDTRFKTQEPIEEEFSGVSYRGYPDFFIYDEQLAQMKCTSDGYDVVSVQTGKVLKTYNMDCFMGIYGPSLYMDSDGTLWALHNGESGQELLLHKIEETSTVEQDILLFSATEYPFGNPSRFIKFAVSEDYVFLNAEGRFLIYNRENATVEEYPFLNEHSASMEAPPRVNDFCLDGQGGLYLVEKAESGPASVEKISLATKKTLWSNENIPIFPEAITYSANAGVCLLCDNPEQKVISLNPGTGEIDGTLLNLWSDTTIDLSSTSAPNLNIGLYVGLDETIYLSVQKLMQFEGIRTTHSMIPYTQEQNEDTVTLTITAPYVVDSVNGALKLYQRTHPNVNFVWDTSYISREEFGENAKQYYEQIRLRMIAGDVGDIQMVVGAAIEQDILTDTDVFADLSGYLDASPVKPQLAWNYFEALRGKDGAIRGVPVAVKNAPYWYNQKLLEQLDMPIDPNTVKWSELLKLAVQWKEEGKPYCLLRVADGELDPSKTMLLQHILLANLYSFQKEDGSVCLDEPYLRELLTDLKELWDTPYLITVSGSSDHIDFLENALFTTRERINSNLEEVLWCVASDKAEFNQTIIGAPQPSGENTDARQQYGFIWAIPASSQQQEAAWDFLEFLLSKDGLPAHSYSMDTIPVNNDALNAQYEQFLEMHSERDPLWDLYPDIYEAIKAAREVPVSRLDQPRGWREAVYNPICDYLNGKITLDEAIETAQYQWERLLMG